MNGSVVQAFLELSTKDNGNVRYRIQRHQLQGLFWRLEENNLVKQDYMWVGPGMNLSVVNYPVLSGDKILQYMSLVYWGNDDSPKYRPLNCAYVQADYLQFDSNVQADSTQIANPKNTQFVGYIEGLPPYYVNDSARRVPYEYTINASANAISEAEYEIKNGTSTDQSYSYNTKASVSCDFLFFESELSYSFGKKWGTVNEQTVTTKISRIAEASPEGYYIVETPVIMCAIYKVFDVNDHYLYPLCYYYMGAPQPTTITAPLQAGLVPCRPETYRIKPTLDNDKTIGPAWATTWTKGGGQSACQIAINNVSSLTTTHKSSISNNMLFGEFFGVKIENSFEYELTTTIHKEIETSSVTELNDPYLPTDVKELDYNTFWILPTKGQPTWWLYPDQDAADSTWCLTYRVYHLKHLDGTGFDSHAAQGGSGSGSPSGSGGGNTGQSGNDTTQNNPGTTTLSAQQFQLLPACPNPASTTTRFRYRVGRENSASDNTFQTKLLIYDMNGNVVASVVDEPKTPGYYEVTQDVSTLLPGVYIYEMQSGNFRDMKKLVLIR